MGRLGVDDAGCEERLPTGLRLVGIGIDPDLDRTGQLAAVMGAVEEMLANVGMVETARLAREHGVRLHTHLAEHCVQGTTVYPAAAHVEMALAAAREKLDPPPVGVEIEVATQLEEENEWANFTGTKQSSPGMVVMFGMTTMLGIAIVLVQERRMGTMRRLLTTPASKASILAGKYVGIFALGLLQTAILIVFGRLPGSCLAGLRLFRGLPSLCCFRLRGGGRAFLRGLPGFFLPGFGGLRGACVGAGRKPQTGQNH